MKMHLKEFQKVLIFFACAALIALTLAVCTSGFSFSEETFHTFIRIFRGMTIITFWVSFVALIIAFIFTYGGCKRENRECNYEELVSELQVTESRERCRETHGRLFAYLQQNILKGYDDPECRRLHDILERELERHCATYPSDFSHTDVAHYRLYIREVREIKAIS